MMEVVVTTGAIRRANIKLQSNRHQQQTITHFYKLDALPVAQATVSTEH